MGNSANRNRIFFSLSHMERNIILFYKSIHKKNIKKILSLIQVRIQMRKDNKSFQMKLYL
jgi:hypothetical protein